MDILSLDIENEAIMNIIGQAANELGTTSSLPLLKNLWAGGGEGLAMFHSVDEKFSVCVASPVRTDDAICHEESAGKMSGKERKRRKSAELFNPFRLSSIFSFYPSPYYYLSH